MQECSMTYRQSETYSHNNASKTYHYSLFHPRGILNLNIYIYIQLLLKSLNTPADLLSQLL